MSVFVYMLIGAGIGLGVAVAIWILGFLVDLMRCACSVASCNGDVNGMWEGGAWVYVLLVCVILGAVIGLIYGIYKVKVKSDEARAQREAQASLETSQHRQQLAADLKKIVKEADTNCTRYKNTDIKILKGTYSADKQMKDILDKLRETAEIRGEVKAAAKGAGYSDNQLKDILKNTNTNNTKKGEVE